MGCSWLINIQVHICFLHFPEKALVLVVQVRVSRRNFPHEFVTNATVSYRGKYGCGSNGSLLVLVR